MPERNLKALRDNKHSQDLLSPRGGGSADLSPLLGKDQRENWERTEPLGEGQVSHVFK